MKKIIALCLYCLLGSCNIKNNRENNNILDEECIPCSIEVLNQKNLKSMEFIKNVICTLDWKCNKNVEFSETFDETIFKIIKENSRQFLSVFSKIEKNKKNLVLNKISAPLLDYDFDLIITNIKSIKGFDQEKILLLAVLEKAKKGDI